MSKVLVQISSSLNCGAPGRIVEQIGLLAESRGWICYVVHGLKYANPSKLKSISVDTALGEKIHTIKSLIFDNHGLNSKSATKRLIEKLKKINPDIIHIHNLHGYFINYKVLFEYLKESNKPIVWTLHDCWPFTGHCAHFDFIGCDHWKKGCNSCPAKNTYPKSFIFSQSAKNYKIKKELFTSVENNITLVPVSKWLENFIKDSFLKKCKVHTIYNGIDINSFIPSNIIAKNKLIERHNLANKFVIMGCAAPWHKRKGYYDFYKLRTILPNNIAIVMVGLDSQQKKNADNAGIIGIIRTENQAELADYYSMADVFVNPTYEDNFPTTNLEALACGTPVITYKTGGSPESIDEFTGIVVQRGNVSELVDAIMKIYALGKFKFTKACRDRAERLYNKYDRFEEYLKLYEQILKNKDNL